MSRPFHRIILFACMSPLGLLTLAQGGADAHVRAGDRYFQQMAYAPAIDEYRVAAEEGAVNEHVTKRLAESYMRVGNTVEAEHWYALTVKYLNRDPRDLYNYAQALKSNGKYELAEEWMDRYLALTPDQGEVSRSNIVDYSRKFELDADRYTVRPVAINSPFSDMAPAWLGKDQIVFSSARGASVGIRRTAAWNGQPFLDLYVADRSSNGDLGNVRPLEGNVNTSMHEGPVTASAGADVMWFTRNNRTRSRNGISRLSVYKARRSGGSWDDIEPFLYNNPECSVGHPALSPDGRTLYFVSDMPGGFGGSDIYVCRDLGGQWSEPENLGDAINTSGNEVFPFVGADGTLYFASNGHPGLGGLDIFASPPAARDRHELVINMGAPVNSARDDFGLIIDPAAKTGYFTSNRPGDAGDDDLYYFEMHRPLEQRYLCTGTVFDDEHETPVIGLDVELLDRDGKLVATSLTDARGDYSFAVEKDREYRIKARMKGHFDGEQHLSTENADRQQILVRDIHLVPDAGIWLRGAARYKDHLGFIPGMTVSLVNLGSFFTETRTTDDGGDFNFRLQPNEKFEVLLEKPGYFSMSVPVTTVGMRQGVIDLNEAADLSFEAVNVGKPVRLKYVRWSQGSTVLDPAAKGELDALAERLLVNPAMLVEIAVHSDARGDLVAEQKLSQKRADAIVDYLKNKGVPKDRMTARGYGATRLLNHCAPGVQCTEEEHAENRRTEYTVTAIRE